MPTEMEIVIETTAWDKTIVVYKEPRPHGAEFNPSYQPKYRIYVDGEDKHNSCTAEDVMRFLSETVYGLEHSRAM